MAKYLKYFPTPLLEDLIAGRWLPIVGAGMSANAKVPSGSKMPLWSELGEAIEKDIRNFRAHNALDAISAFEHSFGRTKLVEKLTSLLLIDLSAPGRTHQEFCSIPFDIVCTTNFDFLLEQQYRQLSRNVYPVLSEHQLSVGTAKSSVALLKIHGDVHHPSRLVATEEDYDGFLNNYPLLSTYISNLLITRTAVLIGYSLDDPDLRQLWHVVSQRLGKARRPAYALSIGARPADKARFARRGIELIDLPGSQENYGDILATAFAELSTYYVDNILKVSSPTEEDLLRELQLPPSAASRICFFSVPLNILSFYKEYVFPTLEAMGFIPLSADDVISPGDNIFAKIEAIVARAAVVVIEAYPDGLKNEAEFALAKRRRRANETTPLEVVYVLPEGTDHQINIQSAHVIYRKSEYYGLDDQFVSDLAGYLENNIPQQKERQRSEPQRLFNLQEYRAAIISSLSLLEETLRESLSLKPLERVRRPMSLSRLLDQAVTDQLLSMREANEVRHWMRIRNEVVHSRRNVASNTTYSIIRGVNQMIERIQRT